MAINLHGERRQQLCDWLRTNHIDPNLVREDADLTIVETDGARHIRCEVVVTNDQGDKVANERGTDVAIETRTVPLLAEPPAWWRPYVEPTREQAIEQRDQARAALAEVLACFSTVRDELTREVVGHVAEHPIHPADFDRWWAPLTATLGEG
jgi:hypothetical protein